VPRFIRLVVLPFGLVSGLSLCLALAGCASHRRAAKSASYNKMIGPDLEDDPTFRADEEHAGTITKYSP